MNSISNRRLNFRVEGEAPGSKARASRLTTLHNEVETPVFMPVATRAVIRTQDMAAVDELGFPVLLANTYHLLIRPGTDVFRKFGGIHKFMNWERSVLTDSGGFQVFSLPNAVKISEEGAAFRSYHDGSTILLSPEKSIETQKCIGSDIMMAMDQCIPSTSEYGLCEESVELTARWAGRSLAARGDSLQSIFGIVQGACYPDLRKRSAGQITALPFDGYAIGGLAVGETGNERNDMTELTASLLPPDYPRYLMGVGTPIDLLEAVHRGVDMFDCILPTSHGQQGVAYTSQGIIELRRGVYKFSDKPIDENCTCPACRRYSRGYIHHLIKTGEYYGGNLVGVHNLTFYRNLMQTMRRHILAGDFYPYYLEQRDILVRGDENHPPVPTRVKKRKETLSLGSYEVVRQDGGFHSIRHVSSGEVMHSVTDPLVEAKRLYVDQLNIAETLSGHSAGSYIVWDVGLGAGTNAMATVREYEKIYEEMGELPELRIISFENDLDSLRLAVKNPSLFPHVKHPAPAAILGNAKWRSARFPVEWILLEGDFREHTASADAPHCIYYDPFSLHTDTPLWRYSLFRELHEKCSGTKTMLFTYSSSTQVRGALLAAGFYVGRGAGTGPKSETTAAFSTPEACPPWIELLDREWLGRFERSSSKHGADCSEEEKIEIERRVLEHPQFDQ
ncbi:MAG TPA: tRNA guanosine(34) transglycosylase Tgt [Spirochaetota bacterium]|nr:tRNA guanosine(34) transglycosylase Tgt [Spirochaetota bacterium]